MVLFPFALEQNFLCNRGIYLGDHMTVFHLDVIFECKIIPQPLQFDIRQGSSSELRLNYIWAVDSLCTL